MPLPWLSSKYHRQQNGASALSISTAELPQGQYLVSLIIDNNVVETVHATKQ